MLKEYDIIIAGAGPAGANFARLVDTTKYKVLIIDGSDRHRKVCGGLISPDAQAESKNIPALRKAPVYV